MIDFKYDPKADGLQKSGKEGIGNKPIESFKIPHKAKQQKPPVKRAESREYKTLEQAAIEYLRALNDPLVGADDVASLHSIVRDKFAEFMARQGVGFLDDNDHNSAMESYLNSIARKFGIRRDDQISDWNSPCSY